MTPKENYLYMMRGNNIPEYMPSMFEPYRMPVQDELLTPNRAPDGPIVTSLGVTYVGTEENNWGAMPEPGKIILDDITKWRDIVKIRDVTGRDWEGYYKKVSESIDREKMCVSVDGGDYFLTLVSLMGFEGALMAMYEEPEEVKALFEYISEFYTMVLKKQFYYLKPESYILMDDDSAYRAPFFSVELYRELIKPFHKIHCDIAINGGAIVDRHDCGKSEQFIDDWLEIGVKGWNPAQITNDLKGIKAKYGDRLVLSGCWDSQGRVGSKFVEEDELIEALYTYTDTFAPGGNFCFSAHIGGLESDVEAAEKRAIIKKFFFDYARDYYKTH